MIKQFVMIINKECYIEFPIENKIYLDKDFIISSKENAKYTFEKIKDNILLNEKIYVNPFNDYFIEDNIFCLNFINLNKKFNINDKKNIIIGKFKNNDICVENLDFTLNIDFNDKQIYIISKSEKNNLYFNGVKVKENNFNFDFGDNILFNNIKFNILNCYIEIIGDFKSYSTNLEEYIEMECFFEDFPKYKRSPRLIKSEPLEKVDILLPPEKPQNKKGYLAKTIIPPLVMLILTIVISIIQPRGIFVIMSIAGTLMSTIFSLTSYFSDKKDVKQRKKSRKNIYEKYLLNIRKQLNSLYNSQKEALEYNNINPKKIQKLIEKYDSRIYERNNNDDDFLNLSIGTSKCETSFKVNFNNKQLQIDEDPLINQAKQVYNKFKKLKDVPYPINLRQSNLGLVGEKDNIHNQLKLIISQLTFNQSYQDIEIVFLYNQTYKQNFEFAKWYPHFKIKNINIIGLISCERVRDQVLGNISQILKDRKLKKEENKKNIIFSPYYIFIIDEPKLVINHPIMEYLQSNEDDLGFSIIYTTNLKANLPENVKTVLLLENSKKANLILNKGLDVNKKIKLYDAQEINFENLSRKLSCLEHIKGVTSQIPKSVTFFEMYEIEHPKQLNSKLRWENNSSHKTLAVPIGVRAKNDIVYLNLHEKAAGPHGLIAGTTGSGKSEIIQSYILSLAINFHPYEVGFLLIDYKGGGMASLFKNLPHLMGIITNLDGTESKRAMASIKSELESRQHIFNKYGVNHIDQYNKLFGNNEVEQPLPHLFIISDEFAELKKEQPEFMTELVSAARIGRSLGIHLILATQKPSGIVDDQIWTNSKFKLALKVATESDSNEIIKTPDAATITIAGRAYLQVGNNEIYELFQSAWSGAQYVEEKEEFENDNRVYLMDELGQARLLNKDLSDSIQKIKTRQTELEVTVNYLKDIFNELNIKEVKKPWLKPLSKKIISPNLDINNIKNIDEILDINLEISLGLLDIPEQQKQIDYKLDFSKDGNLAVFASGGFGKTNTLINIMFNLSVNNNPKNLIFYILDFGNANLIQMKDLPHTADYFRLDDNQKLNKLIKLLDATMKNRKKLFAEYIAPNFNVYNKVSENQIPAIFVIIDNYDVVKELGFQTEDFITKLSRDGVGLGIYTIITASRSNAVKYTILNNFKNKVALCLLDAVEYSQIIGRPIFKIPEIEGRGLIKRDNVNLIQTYIPFYFENDLDYSKKVNLFCDKIKNSYSGKKNDGIPMLPQYLDLEKLELYIDDKKDFGNIVIGLDYEQVKPQYINLNDSPILIVGSPQKGKTNLLKNICYQIRDNFKTYIIDSTAGEMQVCVNSNIVYVNNIEKMTLFIQQLKNIIQKRRNLLEKEKNNNPLTIPKNFYISLNPICVLIDDVDNFIELLKSINNLDSEKIILDAINVNICFIATTLPTKLKGFDNISKILKDSSIGIILGNPTEQTLFTSSNIKKFEITEQTGFIFNKYKLTQVQIPKYKLRGIQNT